MKTFNRIMVLATFFWALCALFPSLSPALTPNNWSSSKASDKESVMSLFSLALKAPQLESRAMAFRYLPRLKKPEAMEKSLSLLKSRQPTKLKKHLILGMGESKNSIYADSILLQFKDSFPEIQEAATKSLGRMGEKRSVPIFKKYMKRKSNWYKNILVTEAIMIALGQIKPRDAEKFLVPILKTLPDKRNFHVQLAARPDNDRIAGAFAWAMGDLSLYEKHQDFIDLLFASQSPRGSIMAAKTLCVEGNNDARNYLINLSNNPSVLIDLRKLSGRSLAACLGFQSFDFLRKEIALNYQVGFSMLRELEDNQFTSDDFLLKILQIEDEWIQAEALIIISNRNDPQASHPQDDLLAKEIQNRLSKTKKPVMKALLRYNREESASE